MAVDPVCKMEVDEKAATDFTTYDQQKYYFCSPTCKEEFEENPEQFRAEAA
jgi:YHS domain-containing protein